ncbi:hypothetical protein MUY14_46110 [Amycolatopsis sp. FBCC-B4732]|uniref:hypothetical protein n=1 Tax=Amycolatopsis sp. FBCC-B4732 TaxID=3079339 RepID=UPI001FF29CB7|nr:hypothetical protein [Amycolatopsis sp. FBCC-B4732]UOX88960.1 hypothetical protein MUY14_46110 [Amycolatopsis sp. FBCC-B4732]
MTVTGDAGGGAVLTCRAGWKDVSFLSPARIVLGRNPVDDTPDRPPTGSTDNTSTGKKIANVVPEISRARPISTDDRAPAWSWLSPPPSCRPSPRRRWLRQDEALHA